MPVKPLGTELIEAVTSATAAKDRIAQGTQQAAERATPAPPQPPTPTPAPAKSRRR